MAIRIDYYAIVDGGDLDHVEASVLSAARAAPGTLIDEALMLRFLGHVSADDDDEAALFALLQSLADQTGIFDARAHGTGMIAVASLDAVRVGVERSTNSLESPDDTAVRRAWSATISAALSTATALAAGFAWETRYDTGGTIDDGPFEYTTSWGHTGPVD